MSGGLDEEIERTRTLVQRMLQRVPAKVNNGSYNMSVAYKKLALRASKIVNMKSPKYIDIQSAFNELSQFQ